MATATAIALLVAVVALINGRAAFVSADEARLARALEGCFADRPMVWAPFLSPALSRGLSLLYRLLPGVTWYAWLQRALMLAGMSVVNYCLLERISKRFPGRLSLAGCAVCAGVSGLLSWALTRMSAYYAVGIGGAAVVCLVGAEGFGGRRFWPRWIAAVALFSLCAGFLPVMGVGLFALLLPVAACRLAAELKAGDGRAALLRRGVSLILATGLVLALTLALGGVEQGRLCDDRYPDWSALRAVCLRGSARSYSKEPKRFEKVGWTEDFSELAADRYFMDERINAEALAVVLEGSVPAGRAMALRGPADTPDRSKSADAAVAGLAVMLHGLALCLLCGVPTSRSRRGALIPAAYTLALDALWLFAGRRWGLGFPEAFALAAPCILLMAVDLTDCLCGLIRAGKRLGWVPSKRWIENRARMLTALIGVIVAGVGCVMFASGVGETEPSAEISADREREYALREYAAAHRDRKLVRHWDAAPGCDPFETVGRGAMINLFYDDAFGRYGYCDGEQLRLNGLKAPLTSADFGREDVAFVCDSEDLAARLLRFLGGEYGLRAGVVEEELEGGLMVVRFQPEYDVDSPAEGEELPVRVMVLGDAGVAAYRPVQGMVEGTPVTRWMREDAFAVYYHLSDEAEACDRVTQIPCGEKQPTLTVKELGFSVPGKRFAGWKARWAEADAWRVTAGDGEARWTTKVYDDTAFELSRDGRRFKDMVPAGDSLHLYAQWKDKRKVAQP